MKQIDSNLCGRWLIPACLCLSCLNAYPQKITLSPPAALPKGFAEQTKFIIHASVTLPALLQQRKYDSIQNFLINWEHSRSPDEALIFGGTALLAMETGRFASMELPCDCLYYLADYAKALHDMEKEGALFKYHIVLDYRYAYDATEDVRKTLIFYKSWARTLLSERTLDKSERFVAKVLAGEISDPKAAFHADRSVCPRIARVEDQVHAYNQKVFINRRDSARGTAAVMVGGWFPTGHLRTLGAHPSIGVQLGGRNKLNEYDVTYIFRFLHPTPQEYTFTRNDTVHTSRYYDGGYLGFEYTRYFLHKKYVDLGFTSGIAYDYFSVTDGVTQHIDGLSPVNVGSFDFNNGIRFKYFLRRKGYVGLTAKYHLINYVNKGGTDLSGNAFTLDLSFGSH